MRLGATGSDAYLDGLDPRRLDGRRRQRPRGLRPGRRGARGAVDAGAADGVPRRPRPRPRTSVNRLRALLGDDTTVLLDGGMGTLLQENGLDDGGSGELWNVDRPDVIEKIHEAYAEAGARLLTTNTFGGTRPRLAMHGLEDRVHDVNRAGAEIATRVARKYGAYVAGDLGPTGELLAPLGTMGPDDARALFEEQLIGLRDGGIDVVLIETMSDLGEVVAAVEAARRVVPDAPVIATLSFDTNLRSMMGVRPADAVRRARGGRGGRRRRELRPRTGGDGDHRRRAGQGAGRRRPHRRPVQRRPAAAGRRPVRVRRPARGAGRARRGAARPGRRPDRGVLRLDARARRGDEPGVAEPALLGRAADDVGRSARRPGLRTRSATPAGRRAPSVRRARRARRVRPRDRPGRRPPQRGGGQLPLRRPRRAPAGAGHRARRCHRRGATPAARRARGRRARSRPGRPSR